MAEALKDAGFEPVLPDDLDTACMCRYTSKAEMYRDVLPADIQLLAECEAAVSLPGYECSEGCGLEMYCCDVMRIPFCVPEYSTDEWAQHDALGLDEWVDDTLAILNFTMIGRT